MGLLQRRAVQIDRISYIRRESNKLEEVDAGLVQSADEVYPEYCDPSRDERITKIVTILRKIPLSALVKKQVYHGAR